MEEEIKNMSADERSRIHRAAEISVKRMKRVKTKDETAETTEKFQSARIPKRRVMMLMVQPGEFMFLFTKGLRFQKNFKVIKGVPDDAKVIAVAPDSMRNGIMIVITSSEFEEVPINVLPPVIPVDIDLAGIKNATKKKAKPRKKRR